MTHQVIICSYKKDFPWLIHALASLRKFASGFLSPVVCVDGSDEPGAREIVNQSMPEAKVVVTNGRPGQGFMRAQIAMCKSDLLCPDADNIYFLGSDCIAHRALKPETYCDHKGRPAVLYSSYESIKSVHHDTFPWRDGVNRILGIDPENEYMRRLPSVFPRSIFAPMRAHIEKRFGKDFEDYIYTADDGKTSEANLLGAFAHRFMPETCHWVNIADAGLYGSEVNGWPSAILQLWSHGGLDRPMEANVEYTVTLKSVGKTPRRVINDILYPSLP